MVLKAILPQHLWGKAWSWGEQSMNSGVPSFLWELAPTCIQTRGSSTLLSCSLSWEKGFLLASTGVYIGQRDVGRAEGAQRLTAVKDANRDCSGGFQKLQLFLLPTRRTGALDRWLCVRKMVTGEARHRQDCIQRHIWNPPPGLWWVSVLLEEPVFSSLIL